MDVWDRLETIIPMGEDADDVASLRRNISERNGDLRAISSMELYRIYKEDAGKRTLLAPLLRHLAKRHLHVAQLSADVYPDPLAVLAAQLAAEGDLWLALEKFEVLMPRQRAWIGALPEPDVSQHVKLCTYLAAGAAVRSQLGQFEGALEWYMQAFEEFNRTAPEVRAGQPALEDEILSGVVRSLLSQFRYEDALFFIDLALKGEMFSAYQSDVRHDLRVQMEILPELVDRTRGYEFPASGLKLWADLMDEVQRCKSPDEAREVRRKILGRIEMHEAGEQIRHLEDGIENILGRDFRALLEKSSPPARPAVPPPQADLSGINDPAWRSPFEKVNRAIKALQDAELKRSAQLAEIRRNVSEISIRLNQRTIEAMHQQASQIYRVPLRFWARWNLRAVVRLAVQLLALEFLIGKLGEKLLESQGESVLKRLHFGVREGVITAAVTVVLFFLSMPAEKRIDEMSLRSYKRLLLTLVADRVTRFWATYNGLLRVFTQCRQEMADLEKKLQIPAVEIPPAAEEKAS